MKKLMITAAAAAMIGGAFAKSACDPAATCPEGYAFKFSASGKIGVDADVNEKGYKTVDTLKFSGKSVLFIGIDYTPASSGDAEWDETVDVPVSYPITGAEDAYGSSEYSFLTYTAAAAAFPTNGTCVPDTSWKCLTNDAVALTKDYAMEAFEGNTNKSDKAQFVIKVTPEDGSMEATQTYTVQMFARYVVKHTATSDTPASTDYYVNLYLNGKMGKLPLSLAIEGCEVYKWSYFGKNFDVATDDSQYKPGKSYSLDTDLGFMAQGINDNLGEVDPAVYFMASGFGKLTKKFSKRTEADDSVCNPGDATDECIPSYIFKNYSGWFAGYHDGVDSKQAEPLDPTCYAPNYDDCTGSDNQIFGGTWKASYLKAITTLDEALEYAGM